MNDFSVSVVIPATDETYALAKTVDCINNQCKIKPEKVIIVLARTASAGCKETVQELKSRYCDRLELTVQTKDGLGNASNQGMRMVKTTHMTFLPADLAIELESLDRMISLAKANPDVVVKSSRWLNKGSFEGYGKLRLLLNKIAQGFLRILFHTNLTDLTNPVQVIPTAYEQSVNWREEGFCTLIEHTIVPVRLGYKFIEVPAKCFPRTEGKSKNSWLQTAAYLKVALRIRFSTREKLLSVKKV